MPKFNQNTYKSIKLKVTKNQIDQVIQIDVVKKSLQRGGGRRSPSPTPWQIGLIKLQMRWESNTSAFFEYCRIFKNTYFEERLQTATSENITFQLNTNIYKMNPIKPWWVISNFTGARSSHRRYSIKKSVNKNFAIFTGKCLCWILFVGVYVLQAQKTFNFMKKRLQHSCFPVNNAEF